MHSSPSPAWGVVPIKTPYSSKETLRVLRAASVMSSPFALKPLKPLPAPGAIRPLAVPVPQPLKPAGAAVAPLAMPAARAPLGMPATVPLPAPPRLQPRLQPGGLSPPGAAPRQSASPLAPLPKPPQLRSPMAALPQPPQLRSQASAAVSDTSLNSWVTCVAEDGTPYFYHPVSGKTSWDWRDGGDAYGAQAYGSSGALPAATRMTAPLARQLSAMPNDIVWDVVLVLPLPQQDVRRKPTCN